MKEENKKELAAIINELTEMRDKMVELQKRMEEVAGDEVWEWNKDANIPEEEDKKFKLIYNSLDMAINDNSVCDEIGYTAVTLKEALEYAK